MRKKELIYNVLVSDWNENKIKEYNILAHIDITDLKKKIKKGKITNKGELKQYVRSQLMYHCWSRCEYEIFISDLSDRFTEKIDAFKQADMNLDLIVDYISNELKLRLE